LKIRRKMRMVFYMCLLGIFGTKRDEIKGELKKLHNEELYDLYSSPSIVRVIKTRRMRWAGHVPRMGREEVCTGFAGET
jgi:hypothetical protein